MSVLFDAGTECLTRTSSLPGWASFTVCGWAKANSYTAGVEQVLFQFAPVGAVSGAGGSLDIENGGGVASLGFWNGSSFNSGTFASRPSAGEWFFWYVRGVSTSSGGLQAGWRRAGDAAFVTTSATLNTYSAWAQWWLYGHSSISGKVSNGLGARVKTWGVALSDAELLAEMLASSPVKTANIDSFLPLDNSSSSTWGTDQSGAGHNWTVSSTPTFDSARPPTAFSLTASAGAYTLTGQAATLKAGRKVAAGAGAFSLTGQAATLKRGLKTSASTGSFALTGQAAALKATRTLSASSGAFTFTGQAATLKYGSGYRLAVDPGVFALTGQPITARAARKLSASGASYSLTGQAATLSRDHRLSAGSGAYSLTGQDAAFTYVRHIVFGADAGSFLLSGQDAALRFATADGWARLQPTAETWTAADPTAETWTAVPPISETWTRIA
jgi:hypothetical protein